MKYVVNKYCGRTYCGNAFYDTFDDCMAFADDGFCDKAVIISDDNKFTIKFTAGIDKE